MLGVVLASDGSSSFGNAIEKWVLTMPSSFTEGRSIFKNPWNFEEKNCWIHITKF